MARIGEYMNRHTLTELGKKHGTDKCTSHSYTGIYDSLFSTQRDKEIILLEIGIGGDHRPGYGGHSLRMWKEYFFRSKIYGIDIHNKSFVDEDRIKTFQGSQADESFLNRVMQEIGTMPDIIIDDGSHINEHVITTFNILFPFLKNQGFYIVEDIQTSYWPTFGGDLNSFAKHTSMNFFLNLANNTNHSEFLMPNYTATYTDKNIFSVSFYHNLVAIVKDDNTEPSNLVKNGILTA